MNSEKKPQDEEIPEEESWIYKDKETLEAIKRGLEQAARGEGKYLGSFAKYAEEDLEDSDE